MKLWDNEILMGWYVADEGRRPLQRRQALCLHQRGIHMAGRWVGLSYDDPIITGWAAMARSEEEALAVLAHLKEKGVPPS